MAGVGLLSISCFGGLKKLILLEVHICATSRWLGHGCSVGTDGLCVDVNMVGTWMLCGNTDAGCKHVKTLR